MQKKLTFYFKKNVFKLPWYVLYLRELMKKSPQVGVLFFSSIVTGLPEEDRGYWHVGQLLPEQNSLSFKYLEK